MNKSDLAGNRNLKTRPSLVFPVFSHTVLDQLQLCLCMPGLLVVCFAGKK